MLTYGGVVEDWKSIFITVQPLALSQVEKKWIIQVLSFWVRLVKIEVQFSTTIFQYF